jgi:hypothetical protein
MFRASCTHHQECKILTRQPPVQVGIVAGRSSLHHIRDETVLKADIDIKIVLIAFVCISCYTSFCLHILLYQFRPQYGEVRTHLQP